MPLAPPRIAMLLWSLDPADPPRLAAPFFHAAAAAALDAEVELYFVARSVLLLQPGVADALHPAADRSRSVRASMLEAASFGVRFYACADALAAQGLALDALVPETTGLGGAVRFMERAMDAGWRVLVH